MIQLASSFSGKPRQASMAAYRRLQAENHVDEILVDVKQNKNLNRKKELPVWLPLAESFNNGTRKAEDAQPSGLYFLDIDEKGLTETLWNKVREENLIEVFRIVYFAESAGGGTHIWAWRTPGVGIEEDIQRLATRLGVNYDSHVTDLARCCFMVSEQYVKWLDPVVFEPLTEEQRESFAGTPLVQPTPTLPESAREKVTSDYKGIAYEEIVRLLLYKLGYGDQPVEGERNQALYTLSRYMRYICDFDVQILFEVLPHWGLSDHETLSTIKSAVGSVRPTEMPAIMKEVLATLTTETEEKAEAVSEGDVDTSAVPRQLPTLLQQLADHAPEEFKEATLIAAMPMLGTLATGVRAKYRDGKLNSPSFMVDIEAPQATGKSFIDDEMALLMDPLIKQDEVEWAKEMEYSLAKKNGEEVQNPQAAIRIIEPNIGLSAFLERAVYAKGKHLFTYAPEIETVLKNNKGGAWTEKNDLFRLAYDNKPWGQHRISKDSFSAKTILYYNMVMCGTPNKCRAFFADAESGLVSRVTPVVLPDMIGARMPVFKAWSKEDEESVKRQCICLMDEEGEVELPQINQAIEAWDEQKRQEYLETLQPSLDVFRRRAALNGFRAGMMAYLLEGRKETEAAIAFALWYAERCLHYQMLIYGDKVDALYNDKLVMSSSKRTVRYLSLLGKEFTKQDFVNLRLANGESPVVKTIICRWTKEKKIEKIGSNVWKKL